MEGPSPVGVKSKDWKKLKARKVKMEVKELEGGASEMGADTGTEEKKGEEERTQPQHMVLGS